MCSKKVIILFVDVILEEQQEIQQAFKKENEISVSCISVQFLQKQTIYLYKNTIDYIVIYAKNLSDLNHKAMVLFMCFKNTQKILLCAHENDFFIMQQYTWFFVLRSSKLEQDCKNLKRKLYHLYKDETCYYFLHPVIMRKIEIQHIYYIECNKNYLYIHGIKECWKDRATMKYAQATLSDYNFLLINRGIMVNPMYIMSLTGNRIIMKNHSILYISRSKKQTIYHQYQQLLK